MAESDNASTVSLMEGYRLCARDPSVDEIAKLMYQYYVFSANRFDLSIVLTTLVRLMRQTISPASKYLPQATEWDFKFTFLLINCILPSLSNAGAVCRICSQCIRADMGEAIPDSSQHNILEVYDLYIETLDSLSNGDEYRSLKYIDVMSKHKLLSLVFIAEKSPLLVHLLTETDPSSTILHSLVKNGISITSELYDSESLLHKSARLLRPTMSRFLISQAQGLVTLKDSIRGFTPVQTLLQKISLSHKSKQVMSRQIREMIIDLVSGHLELVWDSLAKSKAGDELCHVPESCPLYLSMLLHDEDISIAVVNLASQLPSELWDKDVMILCLRTLLKSDRLKELKAFFSAFNPLSLLKQSISDALVLRCYDCLDYLLDMSMKDGKHIHYPTSDYPLIHTAIMSDYREYQSKGDSISRIFSVSTGTKTKRSCYVASNLISYFDVDDVPSLLTAVYPASDQSQNVMFKHVSSSSCEVFGVLSPISLACLLNDTSFLQAIMKYCDKYGIPREFILFPSDSERKLSPISASIFSGNSNCLEFFRNNFLRGTYVEALNTRDILQVSALELLLTLVKHEPLNPLSCGTCSIDYSFVSLESALEIYHTIAGSIKNIENIKVGYTEPVVSPTFLEEIKSASASLLSLLNIEQDSHVLRSNEVHSEYLGVDVCYLLQSHDTLFRGLFDFDVPSICTLKKFYLISTSKQTKDSEQTWFSYRKENQLYNQIWHTFDTILPSARFRVTLRIFLRKFSPDAVWSRVLKAILLITFPSEYESKITDSTFDWWKEFRKRLGYGVSMKTLMSSTTETKMKSFVSALLDRKKLFKQGISDESLDYITRNCFLNDPTKSPDQKCKYPTISLSFNAYPRVIECLHTLYDWAVRVISQRKFYSKIKSIDLKFTYSIKNEQSSLATEETYILNVRTLVEIDEVLLSLRRYLHATEICLLTNAVNMWSKTNRATNSLGIMLAKEPMKESIASIARVISSFVKASVNDAMLPSDHMLAKLFRIGHSSLKHLLERKSRLTKVDSIKDGLSRQDIIIKQIIIESITALETNMDEYLSESELISMMPNPRVISQLTSLSRWECSIEYLKLLDCHCRFRKRNLSFIKSTMFSNLQSRRYDEYSAMSMICPNKPDMIACMRQLKSLDMIKQTCTCDVIEILSTYEITPLHMAIYDRAMDFIKTLYSIFPTLNLDVDVVRYAQSMSRSDVLVQLPWITNAANLSYKTFNAHLTYPCIAKHPNFRVTEKNRSSIFPLKTSLQCKVSAAITYKFFNEILTLEPDIIVNSILLVCRRAMEERNSSFKFEYYLPITQLSDYWRNYSILGQLVLSEHKIDEDSQTRALLIDGRRIPISEFLSDITWFDLSIPAPQKLSNQAMSNTFSLIEQYCRASVAHSPSVCDDYFELYAKRLGIPVVNQGLALRLCADSEDGLYTSPFLIACRENNFSAALRLIQEVTANSKLFVSLSCKFSTVLNICNNYLQSDSRIESGLNIEALYLKPARKAYENAYANFLGVRNTITPDFMDARRCYFRSETSSGYSLLQVQSPFDLLQASFAMIESMWEYFKSTSCDYQDFAVLSSAAPARTDMPNSASSIDSFIRARKILVLLGIPFSRFGSGKSSEGRKDITHRLLDYSDLNPQKINEILQPNVERQLKLLVLGWYRLRFSYHAITRRSVNKRSKSLVADKSYFFESIYLYHNIHESVIAQAELRESISEPTTEFFKTKLKRQCIERSIHELIDSEQQVPYQHSINPQSIASASYNNIKLTSDVDSLRRALRMAYSVIEFARLLILARALTKITTEYMQSNIATIEKNQNVDDISVVRAPDDANSLSIMLPHQWNLRYDALVKARLAYDSIQSRIQLKKEQHGNTTSSSSTSFVHSCGRIIICDTLNESNLISFLKLSGAISSRFQNSRTLLLSAFVELFACLNQIRLSEFLSRWCDGVNVEDASNSYGENYFNMFEGAKEFFHQVVSTSLYDIYCSVGNNASISANWQRYLKAFNDIAERVLPNNFHSTQAHSPIQRIEASQAELLYIDELFTKTYVSSEAGMTKSIQNVVPDRSTRDLISEALKNLQVNTEILTHSEMITHLTSISASKKLELQNAYDVMESLFAFLRIVSGFVRNTRQLLTFDLGIAIDAFQKQQNVLSVLLSSYFSLTEKSASSQEHVLTHSQVKEDGKSAQGESVQEIGKYLVDLGVPSLTKDFKSGRCPFIQAAICGCPRLLEAMIKRERIPRHAVDCPDVPKKSKAVVAYIQKNKRFRSLIWHVIFQAPVFQGSDIKTANTSALSRKSGATMYEECVLILLDYNFPVKSPFNAHLTCLDVAIMKNMSKVVDRLVSLIHGQNSTSMVLKALSSQSCDLIPQHKSRILRSLHLAILYVPMSGKDIQSYCHSLNAAWERLDDSRDGDPKGSSLILSPLSLGASLASAARIDSGVHEEFMTEMFSEQSKINRSQLIISAAIQNLHSRAVKSSTMHLPSSTRTKSPLIRSLTWAVYSLSQAPTSPSSPTRRPSLAVQDCPKVRAIMTALLTSKERLTTILDCYTLASPATGVSPRDIQGELLTRLSKDASIEFLQWVVAGDFSDTLEILLSKLRRQSICSELISSAQPFPSPKDLPESVLGVAVSHGRKHSLNYLISTRGVVAAADYPPWETIVSWLISGHVGGAEAVLLLSHYVDFSTAYIAKAVAPQPHSDCAETLLHVASRRGDVELAEYLLAIDSDPLLPDSLGYSALHCSVAMGQTQITKLLAKHSSLRRIIKAVRCVEQITRSYLLVRATNRRHNA